MSRSQHQLPVVQMQQRIPQTGVTRKRGNLIITKPKLICKQKFMPLHNDIIKSIDAEELRHGFYGVGQNKLKISRKKNEYEQKPIEDGKQVSE